MKKEYTRLKNFPINFMAIVLGLVGFSLALQKAEVFFEMSFFSRCALYFSEFVFILITAIYLVKVMKYPEEFKEELGHPIKINFYPIIAKIFLILAVIYLSIDMQTSKVLWIIGTSLQLFFTLYILSIWVQHSKFKLHHLNPSWFLPIVGNVLVPIAGVHHGFVEISWFFFSIGLVMWLTLFVVIFNRIIFHTPLVNKLIPTLFILFAPPAIAFISYVNLTGELDAFARILYYISLFLFLLVILQVKLFIKLKFYLSWWAYSFPVVALTVATFLMYHHTHVDLFKYISTALFVFLIIIMVLLFIKTTIAIKNKELCVDEDE